MAGLVALQKLRARGRKSKEETQLHKSGDPPKEKPKYTHLPDKQNIKDI